MVVKSEILKKLDEVDALMRERMEVHREQIPNLPADSTPVGLWRLGMDSLKRERDYLQQAISEELSV